MQEIQGKQDFQDVQDWLHPHVAARVLSVSTQTLRDYERIGLIGENAVKRTIQGRG